MMIGSEHAAPEDDEDDGLELDEPGCGAEPWQMNALLGLLAHLNGGRIELDLRRMPELVGRQVAMHFDPAKDVAVVELLPEPPKAATALSSTRRQ
jgi:hypothetical protein